MDESEVGLKSSTPLVLRKYIQAMYGSHLAGALWKEAFGLKQDSCDTRVKAGTQAVRGGMAGPDAFQDFQD